MRRRGLAPLAAVAGLFLLGAAPGPQDGPDTRDYAWWCSVTISRADGRSHAFVTPVRRMSTPDWIATPENEVTGLAGPRQLAWEQAQCGSIERAAGRRIAAQLDGLAGKEHVCSCWLHPVDDDYPWDQVQETAEMVRDAPGPDAVTLVR